MWAGWGPALEPGQVPGEWGPAAKAGSLSYGGLLMLQEMRFALPLKARVMVVPCTLIPSTDNHSVGCSERVEK